MYNCLNSTLQIDLKNESIIESTNVDLLDNEYPFFNLNLVKIYEIAEVNIGNNVTAFIL
jgi:hypothetical protein